MVLTKQPCDLSKNWFPQQHVLVKKNAHVFFQIKQLKHKMIISWLQSLRSSLISRMSLLLWAWDGLFTWSESFQTIQDLKTLQVSGKTSQRIRSKGSHVGPSRHPKILPHFALLQHLYNQYISHICGICWGTLPRVPNFSLWFAEFQPWEILWHWFVQRDVNKLISGVSANHAFCFS